MPKGSRLCARNPFTRVARALLGVTVLFAFFWAEVVAENNTSANLEKNITLSVRNASAPVFMSALFADTGLDVEVGAGVDMMVSGDYNGTITDVLQSVSESLSLSVEIGQSNVRISNSLIDGTPSIKTVSLPVVQPQDISAENSPPQTASKPITSKSTSKENQAPAHQPKHNEIVDKLFFLKNVHAADRFLNDTSQTLMPGAASQLRKLIGNLGVEDLRLRKTIRPLIDDDSVSVIALPSMNAIRVRGRSGDMDLYRDLIESIDSSSSKAKTSKQSNNTGAVSSPSWDNLR